MVLKGASLSEVSCVYNSWCLGSMWTLSCLVTRMLEVNQAPPVSALALTVISLIVVEPVA